MSPLEDYNYNFKWIKQAIGAKTNFLLFGQVKTQNKQADRFCQIYLLLQVGLKNIATMIVYVLKK
jgi:hypothetical protein